MGRWLSRGETKSIAIGHAFLLILYIFSRDFTKLTSRIFGACVVGLCDRGA